MTTDKPIISIFGSNGMLGRYAVCYLSSLNKYQVKSYSRDDIDISNYTDYYKVFDVVKNSDYVINCAGVIKPALTTNDAHGIFMCNSVFPMFLGHCNQLNGGGKVFHITTDCVFCGDKSTPYSESDAKDVTDLYGLSKLLGENDNQCNIRTSIIGEELNHKYSLVEWAKSMKNQQISGFTNHLWNGITCLELIKFIDYLISTNTYWYGTRHIHSEPVNKYELLTMISDAFALNLNISPTEAKEACNRTLKTNYQHNYSFINISGQIKELANFSSSLK